MSLPPMPPTSGNYSFSPLPVAKEFPRRPRVWVPPVIMFGAFAAGYAIPWNLGENPTGVITRIIFPLVISAILCGVAGFYSYRTVPGWRVWTWVALGAMTLNGLQFLVIPAIQMPVTVNLIIWLSNIGLLVCGIAGPEERSSLHQAPTFANPGFKL